MKYLFILAHPDDEVVATGGTIRQLVTQGDEVKVVIATKGEAGAIQLLKGKEKSKSRRYSPSAAMNIRKREFEKSCKILGIKEFKILKYKDGEINNKLVWGKIELEFIEEIEEYKPDVVVTFDHSGWYFHLDHVGVSIATMRAVQRSKHKVQVLLFSIFHPPGIKIRWPYVYQEKLPITHEVNIKSVVKQKIKAIKAHKSQSFMFLPVMRLGKMNKEYFQLVLASRKGKKIFDKHSIFKKK